MKTNKIVHTPFPLHSEVMIKNVNKENKTDPYYEGPFYISGMTTNGSYSGSKNCCKESTFLGFCSTPPVTMLQTASNIT
jgi:hypothetical protein